MRSPAGRADYSSARQLLNAAHRRPDKTSLIHVTATGERSWTTREVADLVARSAAWLRARGVGEGDRVACCAPNDPAHLLLALACQWIGAIVVPLPVSAAPAELADLISRAAPTVTVTTRTDEVAGSLTPAAWLAEVGTHPPITDAPVRLDQHIAALVFTSGSSGEPKGICLSAAGLWWATMSFRTGFDYAQASQVEMVCAPLSHIGGFNGTTIDILCGGGTVVVIDRFEAGPVLDVIERHRVTIGFAVPTMIRALAAHPAWAGADLSSWTRPLIGGDALPPALATQMAAKGLAPIHVWGMTEAGGAGACLTPDVAAGREGSVGTPFPYVDCLLRDDAGQPVTTPGQVAHVWVGGPGTLSGLWEDGRVVAAAWDTVAGVEYFNTGDMGYLDEGGYLTLVGRAERMIHTGGEMVAPPQVEAALLAHTGVRAAAVVGVPDGYWGQRVCAVCVAGTGRPSLAEIRAALAPHLAGWKLPRALTYVDDLPLNGNGKVDYPGVYALAQAAPDIGTPVTKS